MLEEFKARRDSIEKEYNMLADPDQLAKYLLTLKTQFLTLTDVINKLESESDNAANNPDRGRKQSGKNSNRR